MPWGRGLHKENFLKLGFLCDLERWSLKMTAVVVVAKDLEKTDVCVVHTL